MGEHPADLARDQELVGEPSDRPEADGETAEAIDFCDFYARETIRLQVERQPLTDLPGEDNNLYYIPLGVCAVIPPWNFPLAIMAGMTVAALVAGNTVVMKPASVTPLVASRFVEILEEAGLPGGVLNFIPGGGSDVGNTIVEHPLTRVVSFTGSPAAGDDVRRRAWNKRVVLELGGNAGVVVDASADLDLAAARCAAGGFAQAGQSCVSVQRIFVPCGSGFGSARS